MKYLVSIEDSIKDILLTPLGSRVMLPEYGSRVYELIDRRVDESFLSDLGYFVIEAVSRWEHRVSIDRIELISLNNHKLAFRIYFTNNQSMEVNYG